MKTKTRFFSTGLLASLVILPVSVFAHSYGPPPGVTAAPGDDPRACTACHGGTALNGGSGKVEILLPGAATYTPTVPQHITIRVTDAAQMRWGFQFSARLASDPANLQAGSLASTTSFTQVYCSNYTPTSTGTPLPCPSGAIQFISHNSVGTRLGTTGPVTFEFDWTPPATDSGTVTLYVAGNAANGDRNLTGDHIYTAHVDLTPVAAQQPVLQSNGVVSAASFQAVPITPGSWVSILGKNLSSSTRTWRADEIKNGALPTSLDSVNVTINGKPAYVEYVSPTQLNVLAPDDTSTGPVLVQVTCAGGASNTLTATLQQASPAFFTFDGKYLAATHVDGSLLGAAGLLGAATTTTPAKPGEIVVLYGSGFGTTNPVAPAAQLVTQTSPLVSNVTVTIGGIPAQVSFAGLIQGQAGLYQFNVTVPPSVANGDQQVIAQIGGVSSSSTSLTVLN